MDIHTLGQIILGILGITGGVFSWWDKRQIKREQEAEDKKRDEGERVNHERLIEAQRIAAEAVAEVQRLTAQTLERKLDDVKSELKVNTALTTQAAQAGVSARQEAAISKVRWEAVDRAIAEKLLSGEMIGNAEVGTAKVLTDIQKVSGQTLEIVKEVKEAITPDEPPNPEAEP